MVERYIPISQIGCSFSQKEILFKHKKKGGIEKRGVNYYRLSN